MKKIGITIRLDEASSPSIKQQYYDFFKDSDVLIVPLANEDQISEKISSCDGFLIPGGADINPSFYNEKNLSSLCYPESIDILDKKVIEYAYNNNLPILGICRGMQAINVFLGGTLFQDIAGHKEGKHEVKFNNLYNKEILLDDSFMVNSYHHQAINKISDKLVPICFANDGIIEAVTSIDHKILALQWHPELIKESKESNIILEWFLGKL